jgi:hypothetical protein
MSDTPETDAVSEMLDFKVDLDFARKLERERNEAMKALQHIAYSGLSSRNLEFYARKFIAKWKEGEK